MHLEGPFISKEKKGAHPEAYVRGLDNGVADVEEVYGSLNDISIITLAPELPRAFEVVSELVSRDIAVSVGKFTLKYIALYLCFFPTEYRTKADFGESLYSSQYGIVPITTLIHITYSINSFT